MSAKTTRIAAVLACAAVGVLGVDYATFAATGGSFILGRTNYAGATTSLSNTGTGAALKLTTKSTASAPLSVNGKGRVANLNADRVDSLDSTQLQRRVAGTCAVGSAVRAVGATGSVTCTPVPRPAVYDLAEADETVEVFAIDMYSSVYPAGTYLVEGSWSGSVTEAVPAYCDVWTVDDPFVDETSFRFHSGNSAADAEAYAQINVSAVVVLTGPAAFNWYCTGDSDTVKIVGSPDTRFSVTPLAGSTSTDVPAVPQAAGATPGAAEGSTDVRRERVR